MDPVLHPLLLRKSGSAGNRTRDLCICSQKLWPLDHRRLKIVCLFCAEVAPIYSHIKWKSEHEYGRSMEMEIGSYGLFEISRIASTQSGKDTKIIDEGC